MELWDAYREDESLAGVDLLRGEKIPEGLFHLVSEVLVRHRDGSYLLVQRDWSKPNYPGAYEASAGGSVLKGESPSHAAARELQEETGIVARELEPIYKTKGRDTIYYGYLCVTDWDKNAVVLQEGETISYFWAGQEEFMHFMESGQYVLAHKERLKRYLRPENQK